MKIKKNNFYLLAFLVLYSIAMLPGTYVSAVIDPDPDEPGDSQKRDAERIVTVDVQTSSASIDSILKYGKQKDDIKIDILTKPNLIIKGQYKLHDDDNKVNLQFQTEVYSLIEYIDEDGDNVYNEDTDTVKKELVLNSYKPISYQKTEAHIFEMETTDGVFLARVYAVEGYMDINNTLVAPSEVKIDFEIHNFPFTTSNSLLALQIRFQANAAYHWKDKTRAEKENMAENETSVECANKDATGYFAWVENAKADGSDVNVTASPLRDSGNGKEFYLNYPHATDIIHDPKFGVAPDAGIIAGYQGIYILLSLLGISAFLIYRTKLQMK